jgi:hypothetical protein
MADDAADMATVAPDSPEKEAREYEDVTTLNPGSLLRTVRLKKLKNAATRVKVGVHLCVPGPGDGRAASGAVTLDLGGVISQQPDATKRLVPTTRLDSGEGDDDEDNELLDVELEADEWVALEASRYGHSLQHTDELYAEYRKLKAKDAKAGDKPLCCSRGWWFPARGCGAKLLLCGTRCGGPRGGCACCVGVARRARGEVALHGSLPRRNRCDVCLDRTALCANRYLNGPPPLDDDGEGASAGPGAQAKSSTPGRTATVAPEPIPASPARGLEEGEAAEAADDGEAGKPVGPPVLRVGLVHMRAVQALVRFLMGKEADEARKTTAQPEKGEAGEASNGGDSLKAAESEDPFSMVLLSEKEVAAIERAEVAEEAALKARAAKAVTALALDDNPLSLEATWRLTAWLAGSSGASVHLAKLSLCHCDLGPRSTLLVVESLPHLSALQHLALACNPRLSVPVLASGLANPLACPALRHLNVALCEAKEGDLVRLLVATTRLASCPHVRELELWQDFKPTHWSWQHLAMLSEALADWGWLPHAKRPGAEGGEGDSSEEEEEALEDAVEKPLGGGSSVVPPLGLVRHRNKDGTQGALQEGALIKNPPLKEFGVPTAKMRKLPFVVTGRRVRLMPTRWLNIDDLRTTKVVTLAQQELCDQEVFAIACSLGRNKHMRTLDLSYNQFGSVGAKAVLKEVGTKKGLHVDLGGNGLGKDVVGTWLWNACALETLRLTGGGFTLNVSDLKGLPIYGPSGDVVDEPLEVLDLTQEDIGPIEQEALSHLLKFNNACCELNGLVFYDDMTSVNKYMKRSTRGKSMHCCFA